MQSILCVCAIVHVLTVNVKSASIVKRKVQLGDYINTVAEFSDSNNKELGVEVFKLPRAMRPGDIINVTGLMKSDRESVTINLVKENSKESPDYDNVVCQVKLDFPAGDKTKDTIFINNIVDGKLTENDEMIAASGVFFSEAFTIVFNMKQAEIEIDLHAAPATNECNVERYEDIKFLTIGGDIQKVQALNFLLS